jgi:predicted nucleotidyltransferase
MFLDEAIRVMTDEIVSVLGGNKPSVYLYGSVVLNDFKLGRSDIDIIVLTEREISNRNAENLVGLRQVLLERYPGNPYFRLFEGVMLSADAFLNGKAERTVYWGTSGERITDGYKPDSFCMAELLDSGKLLCGEDIRPKMNYPAYAHMRDDIANHARAARKYGVATGWLLDIARGIYTLRTCKIIAKTAAGKWALKNGLCPDADAMRSACESRENPPQNAVDNAVIQRFADVLDTEFTRTVQLLAESELCRMNIEYDKLTLIRDKDGVSVWRVEKGSDSVVLKCFDKPEYRREIANYRLLNSLGVPTLKMIAHTDCSILMEDIERGIYRLGTMEDISNPKIAAKIALWYRTLHENGREYANTNDFIDEYDTLTLDNIMLIQEKTNTGDLAVWRVIEKHFDEIRSAVMNLPRTLVYTDFHCSNLAVTRDGSSALIFDYNFLFKSYVYSDIRNVCGNFYNAQAKTAFLTSYGKFDGREVVVDDVASVLLALITACSRYTFPVWANKLLERVGDGRLSAAVERLIEVL